MMCLDCNDTQAPSAPMITAHTRNVQRRHARIGRLFEEERLNITQIASRLGVTRMTITRDFDDMGLNRFSVISDHDLDELVAAEYLASHAALGSLALEARLKTRGRNVNVTSTLKWQPHTCGSSCTGSRATGSSRTQFRDKATD